MKVGDALPDLKEFELQGELPASLKGKVVLIDFWASWCLPCRESFPVLNQLHERYSSEGLVVLGVNVDESRAAMQTFLKKNRAAFPVVHDARQKFVQTANVETMPSSIIVDGQGRVRYLHSGFHGEKTRRQYVREIEELLGAQHARN